jgi:hypothetical protein
MATTHRVRLPPADIWGLLHRPGLYPELRAISLDCAGPLENVGSQFLSLRHVAFAEHSPPRRGAGGKASIWAMSAAKLLTSASRNRLDLFSNGSLSPNLWTAAV